MSGEGSINYWAAYDSVNVAVLSWHASMPRFMISTFEALPFRNKSFITTNAVKSASLYDEALMRLSTSYCLPTDNAVISHIIKEKLTYIIVWNGSLNDPTKGNQIDLIRRIKSETTANVLYMEHAWLPQSENVVIDTKGTCGASSIVSMKTVPESVEYRDALTAKRTWYRKQCVPIRNVKGTFIYLPLQLNSDTQITLFSPHFKDMGIFIEHTCTLFHEHQILVKCHPKDTPSNITRYEEICGRFSNVIFVNDKNNISYCAQAKAVIAINSTAINEALMFHKPVMAFGYNIFSNKGIVYEVNDIGDIKYQRGFLKFKPNGNLVDRYLRYLLSRQITVTSPEIEKVIPLFTTQSEVPINLLPSVEPSSASRPIINLVMHGPCEWAFESFANHIITHLASRHNIIISEYPIEGASVYQYFRPQIPKAINNLQSLSSRHPFYSRGIHMLHDSPADLQRHNTTWRKANIDKFAKILCLSQEQHNHYSKFIPASKLVYASPGPLKQETFPVITEHNQCGKLRLGFTSRIYPDGVKGVDLYLGIAMLLDPTKFEFVVKSPNAQRLVPILQRGGHTVHTSGNIDILLVTSRFEGLPSTLLEAVASGVYTLSTKVGVAPEILPSDMILPTSPKLWAEHLNGVYNQRNKLKTFIDDSKHLLNFHNWDVYCAILERTWRDIMISNQS